MMAVVICEGEFEEVRAFNSVEEYSAYAAGFSDGAARYGGGGMVLDATLLDAQLDEITQQLGKYPNDKFWKAQAASFTEAKRRMEEWTRDA